jgi:hypothetical protein
MIFKKSNLNILKYQKYHDTQLSISFLDQKQKEYPIHKILFASLFEFFEKLFDHEPKPIYTLEFPFESQIFDIIYDKIYMNKIERSHIFEKDLHYYENILYLLCYLQYNDIKKFLNKIIKYIETNYSKQIDLSSFIENLQKRDLIHHTLKVDFIRRISYDQFIENYYDEKNKRLVLTSHLYQDWFPNEEIEVNGVKFSIYTTDKLYDIQQIGFWLDYEILSEQTNPMNGRGTLWIYSGMNVYHHMIKNFKDRHDRNKLTFDRNGRCGYIKEYVNSIHEREPIDNFITFYKIIIDFD